MKRKGTRMICLTLAGLLCWSVPVQPLTAETLQEDRTATDSTVTGSDAGAKEMDTLLFGDNEEEVMESVDVSSMLYQAGGLGIPAQEDYGIAAYAMISQEEQENLKNDILRALEAGTETLDISGYNIPTENGAELSSLFTQVVNENPKLFYVTGGLRYWKNQTIYTRLEFSYSEVTDEQKAAFSAKLGEAASLVTSAMSEEEKALVLHDYLAQHCAYAYEEYSNGTLTSGSDEYNAYGALVNGKAVCQGYSEAYQALLQEVGIQSRICSSDAMNHAWNVVLIDGSWYHVDVTWDDPVWNREGRALHTFFLLSDTEMVNRMSGGGQNHHDWVDSVDCDSDRYDSASYWWKDIDSQIVQVGHQDYIYVKEASNVNFQIVRKTGDGTEETLYTSSATWPVTGSGGYCWSAQAFLSRQGEDIYFNDNLKIYSMSLADKNVQEVYAYEQGDGFIYGAMVYEDGTARLNIDTTPDRNTDSYTLVKLRDVISVTGVTLSQSSASLREGEELQLTVAVVPDNADNRKVTWTSDDPGVASVTEDGVVTAVKAGTAVIKVTTAEGGWTASCTVTVTCSHAMTETEAKEPTCAAEGNIRYWTCSKCDRYFSDEAGTTEITEKDIVIPVSDVHGATEVRGAKAAEEGKDGYTGDIWCTVCNTMIRKGEIIPALPHTHVMTRVEAVNPTCGTPGNVAYWTCSICEKNFIDEEGKTEAIEIVTPPTGNHRNTVTQNYRPATEEREGYTGDVYCNDCNQVIKRGTSVPKLPHTHSMSKTAAVAAACETDGNVEYWTCSKCGKKYADEAGTQELTDVTVRATGHTPGEWRSDETGHWRQCTVCGKEIVRTEHTFRWVVDRAATEDETGLSHEECACGARRNENTVIPKLDHVHTDIQHHNAVAATCMAKGCMEYWTCSSAGCAGKYYVDSTCQVAVASVEVPVDSHNHVGTGYWSKDAEGHAFICACGAVMISGTHVYVNDADPDCDQCGYKRFYVITGGANAAYETGSENGLTITADGAFQFFRDITVDGRTVDRGNYEVREGSTIVTLKKSYLDTLASGTHEIRVLYTDGKVASTQFTVQEKVNTDSGDTDIDDNTDTASVDTRKAISPKTGEPYQSAQWETVMAVCAAVAAGILVLLRKASAGRTE